MADRPPASTLRVGRPRTRSAHQSTHIPVAPKVGRPRSKSLKTVSQAKAKDLPKRKPARVTLPLELDVVVIDPVEPQEDLDFSYPPDRLPDLPLVDIDQPNQLPNQPNLPSNQPNPQQNLPNQQQNPPACRRVK